MQVGAKTWTQLTKESCSIVGKEMIGKAVRESTGAGEVAEESRNKAEEVSEGSQEGGSTYPNFTTLPKGRNLGKCNCEGLISMFQ